MFRVILITILLSISTFTIFSMPPAPGQSTSYEPLPVYPSEIFPKTDGSRNRELPQNILALMVEFEDVTFDLEPDFPDSLAHDKAYFERLFFYWWLPRWFNKWFYWFCGVRGVWDKWFYW